MNPYESQLCFYHRLNKTQKKICHAFLKIYQQKPLSEMTIKELCDSIPIARTTFYQYYGNLWDVKDIIEDNFVAGLLNSSYELKFFDYHSKVYKDYLDSTLAFLRENRSLFYVLLVQKHDYSFINKYKISIKYHYYDLCHGNEVALEIVAGYLISVFTYFLEHDTEINIVHMEKYLHILEKILNLF